MRTSIENIIHWLNNITESVNIFDPDNFEVYTARIPYNKIRDLCKDLADEEFYIEPSELRAHYDGNYLNFTIYECLTVRAVRQGENLDAERSASGIVCTEEYTIRYASERKEWVRVISNVDMTRPMYPPQE